MKHLLTLTLALASVASMAQEVLNKPRLAVRNWATGLNEPVVVANCGDNRMFVVEKDGIIRIVSDSMVVEPQPFLDLSDSVNSTENEQGMLGLAFEPNYLETGYFYVYYIFGAGNGTSRVSRISVSSDPDSADVASEQVIYAHPQPYTNHNGGDIHFGPDGYLYIGFGDGGSGNDPQNNGQDLTEPLGDLIRIDVSQHDDTFLIPADNPWQNSGDTLPEIWASGLRNPWRWSFDRQTGDVWIGDVGQYDYEEIDFWPAGDNSGPNFGWRCREGFHPNPSISQNGCEPASAYVEPVTETNHNAQGVCSITGGFVYRGEWYPHHQGHYIFTDYCTGDFLTFAAGSNYDLDTMLMTSSSGYSAFGEDAIGQLYVANTNNGQLKKIYDPCPMDDPSITSDGDMLTATAGSGYQWFLNGAEIPGATSQTYLAPVSGNYQVEVNFGSPCTLISDTLAFIASAVGENAGSDLLIFPQPAKDLVTIERPNADAADALSLVDAPGRTVATARFAKGQRQVLLDVSGLSTGTYVARIVANAGNCSAHVPLVVVH